MDDTPTDNPDIPNQKWLKILVTTLTMTMIVGFIVIVILFITKFNSLGKSSMELTFPDEITLPKGVQPTAFTMTNDWYAVVTGDDEIQVFDRQNGQLLHRIKIEMD